MDQYGETKKIVEYHSHNKYRQPMYTWECTQCHKVFGPTTGTDISRSKFSKCCPRRFDQKSNYKGYGQVTGSKMTQIRDSARKRGLACTIDAKYLFELFVSQGGLCGYTGLPIVLNEDASLDRIDSTKGYIPGNVHWVSWKINRMKLNLPHEEFIQLCSLVASRNGDKK